MAISNKLCNPTPFKVDIPYEKGVVITVLPDSSTTLTIGQMDDYRPDKPGSEETSRVLIESGVFLEDPDLDHDRQALVSIRNTIKAKNERYIEARERLVAMHIEAGLDPNPEAPAFQEKLRRMGLLNLLKQVATLKVREKLYVEEVGDIGNDLVPTAPKLDPERTCFATDPPREFPSKTALAVFLAENPEVAKVHTAMVNAEIEEAVDEELNF